METKSWLLGKLKKFELLGALHAKAKRVRFTPHKAVSEAFSVHTTHLQRTTATTIDKYRQNGEPSLFLKSTRFLPSDAKSAMSPGITHQQLHKLTVLNNLTHIPHILCFS